jgi:SAM-dependent methyltransferase
MVLRPRESEETQTAEPAKRMGRDGGKLLSIDLGCGAKKRPGCIGLDALPGDGVDVVVDFDKEPLPFEDSCVGHVFTSHCLEHVTDPLRVFREITRVAAHGAKLEMWVPYAWNNDAFLYDHKTFFNETHFHHMTYLFPDFWRDYLGARWLVHEVVFALEDGVIEDLRAHGVELGFAIRYHQNVVREIGVMVEIHKEGAGPPAVPARQTYAPNRLESERRELKPRGQSKLRDRARRALAVLAGRRG